MISFFPISAYGLAALFISLACLVYVKTVTKRISESHTEMHVKYMAALRQIFDLTIEKHDLFERLQKYETTPTRESEIPHD